MQSCRLGCKQWCGWSSFNFTFHWCSIHPSIHLTINLYWFWLICAQIVRFSSAALWDITSLLSPSPTMNIYQHIWYDTWVDWCDSAAHSVVTVDIQYVLHIASWLCMFIRNSLWFLVEPQSLWQPCKSSWLNVLFGVESIPYALIYASLQHPPPPIWELVCFYGNRYQYGK